MRPPRRQGAAEREDNKAARRGQSVSPSFYPSSCEAPPIKARGGGITARETAEEPPCPAAREEEEEEVVRVLTLPLQAHHAMEKMEEFVYKGWDKALQRHRFLLFLCLGILTMLRPNMYFMAPLQEKVVFGMFFLGAVLCLSFSWLFHTVYCHSEKVSRTFSKLDYSGIALLIMGSFVPWLYYSFYCSPQPRLIYLSIVCVLGISAIIVAQWDRFATPKHRQTRAGGNGGGNGFQSHQIFHVLVVAAAFVHFYGVSNLQEFRYGLEGGCTDDSLL
ncbi:adiponectin receptor protein 1 [Manacus vitellinus]|uniref:adiponectin receptor protein 1 n=1 Tax=Manacus vitellinus TaxID=328815 RepID=UPI00115E6D99|nr:adiponectin receptor protein 1 [Manacus vitellinus]